MFLLSLKKKDDKYIFFLQKKLLVLCHSLFLKKLQNEEKFGATKKEERGKWVVCC